MGDAYYLRAGGSRDLGMMIKGIITALITPFDSEGEVNEGALKKLIEFQIKGGVNGLFLCGTAGLGAIMRTDQRIQAFKVAVKQSRGKIPIIAQVGAPSTEETLRLARDAEAAGVDALGCVTPYYVTPDDESMLSHYKTILSTVKLPVYVYNIPRNAVNNVTTELMKKLFEAGVVGVKDSSRDFVQVMEYLQALPPSATVICGTDSYILPALLMGARGAITGYANAFPEVYAQLWKAYNLGKSEEARQLQFRVNSLRKLLQKLAISPPLRGSPAQRDRLWKP